MTSIIFTLEKEDHPILEMERQSIETEYNKILFEKKKLVQTIDGNPVELMARKSVLAAGLRLFHCTSKTAAETILSQGIKLTSQQSNFGSSDMGKGLYCSSPLPTYFCQNFPVAIALKTAQETSCVITQSLETYLGNDELPEATIQEGYAALQKDACILVNESLVAANTEIVLLDPDHRIVVEGIITDIIDPENFDPSHIIPLGKWNPSLQLHSSWLPLKA